MRLRKQKALKRFHDEVRLRLGDFGNGKTDDQLLALIDQLVSRQPSMAGRGPGGEDETTQHAASWAAPGEGFSIVIPTRDETRLLWTLQNIIKTIGPDAPPVELLVIDDGGSDAVRLPPLLLDQFVLRGYPVTLRRLAQPVGNCYARDQGTQLARYNWCLLLDAHMDFEQGWGTKLWALMQQSSPDTIACMACPQMSDDGARDTYDTARGIYYGAKVAERQITSIGERRILQGVWLRGDRRDKVRQLLAEDKPAEVPCTMGGAYAINREYYTGTLGNIWRYLRGWGTSEPTLCLWARMLGGTVEVWPVRMAHLFRSAAPYRTISVYLRYNQCFLARLLLGPGDRWRELAEHLAMPRGYAGKVEALISSVNWPPLDAIREDRAVMDYDALAEAWIDCSFTEPGGKE